MTTMNQCVADISPNSRCLSLLLLWPRSSSVWRRNQSFNLVSGLGEELWILSVDRVTGDMICQCRDLCSDYNCGRTGCSGHCVRLDSLTRHVTMSAADYIDSSPSHWWQVLGSPDLDTKWVRLAPNWTNPGLFSDQISVHLCTEIWSEKVPDLSHSGPIWSNLVPTLTSLS